MSERIDLRSETRRMISGEEAIDVEYKENITSLQPEDLVAFANAEGGTILIGVREYQSPEGRQCGKIIGFGV